MVIRQIVHIDEELCDGCGNCIPNCAEGALKIIDGKAKISNDKYCDGLGACLGHCPKGAIRIIEREASAFDEDAAKEYMLKQEKNKQDTLPRNQWPVQLNLVPLEAHSYQDADLLITADCVPVAYPDFHSSLFAGKRIVIGCPKFDDSPAYIHKLTAMLKRNTFRSITVAHMEVPCCAGLDWIVKQAVEASGKTIPIKRCTISVKGELK